jgi:hypothetical protein
MSVSTSMSFASPSPFTEFIEADNLTPAPPPAPPADVGDIIEAVPSSNDELGGELDWLAPMLML